MAEAEAEDGEAEQQTERAWVSQTPESRIKGTPTDIIYAGRLDDTVAQNDTSFGVVLEEPEVVNGDLWVNQEKPEDGLTSDGVDEDQSRPTDYRLVDNDDRDTTVANGALVTDEQGPSTYDEAESIEEDSIIVWYNGLSGGRVARTLDFNGRPFADWTDDGSYLVKGLMQPAAGWKGADGSQRSEMASNGRAPRVARAPILRNRVDVERDDGGDIVDATLLDEAEDREMLFDMSRAASGRGYRLHIFDASGFAGEFGNHSAELPRSDSGYVKNDIESELDMPYCPAADDILEQAEYRMHMYTGEGFPETPSNWEPQSSAAVDSFGVSADAGNDGEADAEGFTAAQEQFVREVVDELKGTGMAPEEAFSGGLDGLVGKYSDNFDRVPDVGEVRTEVYERVAHLDSDDLED